MMDPIMKATSEATKEANDANFSRENAEVANGQVSQGGQGSANDESPRDQVLILASILDDIFQ